MSKSIRGQNTMKPRFVNCDRNTLFLMPPSVQDWLPDNHLARFVVDIVSRLDIYALENAYAGRGSDAYPPSMMLSLLFYSYATGVFSSRRIEKATYDSVAFRFIAANTHPDHDTIATFRKRFIGTLKPLFVQILMIAREMGVMKLGKVSLDGTKVKANASKHHALSWQYACRLDKQLNDEIKALLRKAEQADKQDHPEVMSIPDELARREDRLEAIGFAKAEIERRAAERFAKEQEAYQVKLEKRKAKQNKTGKKPRGRKPTPPQPGPKDKDQVNLTDKDSRIMPVSGGGFEQTYNAQAAVDIDSMLIMEDHITQKSNDKLEITPAVDNLCALPESMGTVNALLADTGYFSRDNVIRCKAGTIVPYIAAERQQHNVSLEDSVWHHQGCHGIPSVHASRPAIGGRGMGSHLYCI